MIKPVDSTINPDKRFDPYFASLDHCEPIQVYGRITEVIGLLIESAGPSASVGDVCLIKKGEEIIGQAEVVGFRKNRTLLMPLGPTEGICPGLTVVGTKMPLMVDLSTSLLGRIFNGLGVPLDDKGDITPESTRPVFSRITNPLTRKRITEPFVTGIRAIDGMITIGKGQRMGIFSGSGVGKSVLLGMMAKNCRSDVNVIALVGERGREVREFLERDLGPEGLKRSVVVVATSNEPALIRLKAAMVAATIAEYFRDQGKDVLLMVDSVTRLATAQREIGLAIGEPPATKGYTPSVFAMLPQFLERAGNSEKGTITGLFTVLVDGDDLDEPVSDAARSVLDGHIILSRQLAHKNHYPAIHMLQSISRCMPDVVSKEHLEAIGRVKQFMAAYAESEDLIQIGAYVPGSSPRVDAAIKLNEPLMTYLRQTRVETSTFADSVEGLHKTLKLVAGK